MENQDFIKLLEELKRQGFIYNDADLCNKVGFSRSHISEIRSGKKPVTELTIQRVKKAFPSFFVVNSEEECQRTAANGADPCRRAKAAHSVEFQLVTNCHDLELFNNSGFYAEKSPDRGGQGKPFMSTK